MKDRSRHIIKTQSVELSFEDLEDSIGIQNRIAEVFYERVQPAMNALFDEVSGEKYRMTIDRLEIDSGILSNRNWEDEWVENTIRKLKAELTTKTRKPIEERTVDPEETENYFFFFLEHGHLPWNCRVDSLIEMEKQINFNTGFVQKLKQLIGAVENVAERLVNSFSEIFRDKLIKTFTANMTRNGEQIYSALSNRIDYNNPVFQIAVLETLASDEIKDPETELNVIIEKVLNLENSLLSTVNKKEKSGTHKTKTHKSQNQESKTQKSQHQNETEIIYIENAGLIILHPFLPQLFEATGLIKENQWLHETAQHTAVAILQYLATGTGELVEFNLSLNKILCDMGTEDVFKKGEELTALTKKECEDLLSGIIKHWSVLKNTGTSALRETFLQRNGKLSRVDDGWLLQVEQKAVDILLSSLPWGIGTIKLPWMKDVLYIEWG